MFVAVRGVRARPPSPAPEVPPRTRGLSDATRTAGTEAVLSLLLDARAQTPHWLDPKDLSHGGNLANGWAMGSWLFPSSFWCWDYVEEMWAMLGLE